MKLSALLFTMSNLLPCFIVTHTFRIDFAVAVFFYLQHITDLFYLFDLTSTAGTQQRSLFPLQPFVLPCNQDCWMLYIVVFHCTLNVIHYLGWYCAVWNHQGSVQRSPLLRKVIKAEKDHHGYSDGKTNAGISYFILCIPNSLDQNKQTNPPPQQTNNKGCTLVLSGYTGGVYIMSVCGCL